MNTRILHVRPNRVYKLFLLALLGAVLALSAGAGLALTIDCPGSTC